MNSAAGIGRIQATTIRFASFQRTAAALRRVAPFIYPRT
jgi:hypothetical protein